VNIGDRLIKSRNLGRAVPGSLTFDRLLEFDLGVADLLVSCKVVLIGRGAEPLYFKLMSSLDIE